MGPEALVSWFDFRAQAPVFLGTKVQLEGGRSPEGSGRLWARAVDQYGVVVMSAQGSCRTFE